MTDSCFQHPLASIVHSLCFKFDAVYIVLVIPPYSHLEYTVTLFPIIPQVKYAFYTSGQEVASITFDAAGTSKTSWFSDTYKKYAKWADLATESKNFFSIDG